MSDGSMPSLADRQALCAVPVTLDGAPARVTGYRQPFARVARLGDGLSAEWSWQTVARIVARGGRFKT